jgi:hypothetical protein
MQSSPEAQTGQPTPDSRAGEYVAVRGGAETRSGGTLLVEAYIVLWVILMAWLFFLWRKQARLHARLDELEKVLDQAAAAPKNTKGPR